MKSSVRSPMRGIQHLATKRLPRLTEKFDCYTWRGKRQTPAAPGGEPSTVWPVISGQALPGPNSPARRFYDWRPRLSMAVDRKAVLARRWAPLRMIAPNGKQSPTKLARERELVDWEALDRQAGTKTCSLRLVSVSSSWSLLSSRPTAAAWKRRNVS